MKLQSDSALAIVAALFVLISAMLDPRFSSGLAVALLIVFAIYKYLENRHQPQ